MPPVPESDAPTESLPRLLLGLVWQLAVLVLPILLVASLPLAGAAASVVALALVLIVVARWPRIGKGVSSLLTSGVIGAAFSLGAALPGYWGIGAGVLWVFIGLASAATLERRLGLASAPVTAEPIGPVATGARGTSAWGGGELLTPEGEPVRTLGWGEIAMGGPVYTDYLMPDGVLLEGLGSSARFSDDGRYFAAPIPSRGAWSLAVFDRQLRRLYHCANDAFWELDAFSGGELRGRHSPLVSDQGYRLSLDAVLREATCEDFVAIGDLWLAPGWAERQQQAVLDLSPPTGPHRLRGEPWLPERLRERDDPLLPLRYPSYQLWLDDAPTGLLLPDDARPVWRADGLAFACRLRDTAQERPWPCPVRVWEAGPGWRTLDDWQPREDEPRLMLEAPLALEPTHLVMQARFDLPELDQMEHGNAVHHIFNEELERLAGFDAWGRAVPGLRAATRLELLHPLGRATPVMQADLRLAPLADGRRPLLEWQRESADGLRAAYRCRIGEWVPEGEWCLDHRVSACGRYLALVAFAEAPAVPHRLVVADVPARRLLGIDLGLPLARLMDFQDGIVELAVVTGRLADTRTATPLQTIDQPPPPVASAADFLTRREGSQLCYALRRLRVGAALEPLPDWRPLSQPPASNAYGDFVLPAPAGGNAAWLFGSRTAYGGAYLHERLPRQGGYLLTACGCALADLAPAMAWSADGRYLALTRHDDGEWHLLVLDTLAHRLHPWPDPIGPMPRFEGFSGGALHWRNHPYHDDVAEEAGEPRHLPLDALLGVAPEALEAVDGLWLPPSERPRAAQWRRLDTAHLDPWRPQ
ncbi:hypothetical protein R0G64_16390 [Pseudomonas otitidis]|uniref:Uncharacterized protein n=1 Tax=Metapseudomonas otitidis TaxID=319939 RepID=A0ABU3XT87_9GAMM|nr:hypothetical protein [Pseudomonas otitidis]MDV3441005.1 hypothetical protein [Pseudomonas otitidis]